MVIDDKGGEVIHKDSEKMTKGENFDIGGEILTKEGDKLKFEYTSRGSKLINLIVAFEYALYMFACMAKVLNQNSMLVWCMLVVGLNDEMKN